jgi:GNAT superfamily N-acetyltransferase
VDDVDRVTELFALAFYGDPTWSWAFPEADTRLDRFRVLWGIYMHSAVPYGWVWETADGGAAALWIPPDESELSKEDEALVEPFVRDRLGLRADEVLELMDLLDANHPHDQPHYYLSLLGTHPDHRGRGKGMGLLAANLAEVDAQGLPAYLESSNRDNDRRYARLGFAQVSEIEVPGGGPTLACMWREPSV